MSNKTAMQELLWQLEQLIPEIKNGNAIDKAFWIEKEKQQILDAVSAGFGISCFETGTSCEQYYNETYKPD